MRNNYKDIFVLNVSPNYERHEVFEIQPDELIHLLHLNLAQHLNLDYFLIF